MSRAFVITAVLATAACFNPNLGVGKLVCGTGGLCPDGQKCGFDNHCYPDNEVPLPDMALAPTFVGSGAAGDHSFPSGAQLVFATDTGEVKLDGTVVIAAGSPGFSVIPQPNGGPPVALWEFDHFATGGSVTISQSGPQRVVGICGKTQVDIEGGINLIGQGGFRGLAGKDGSTVGPGTTGGGGKGSMVAGRGGGGGGHGTSGSPGPSGGGDGGMKYGDAQMSAVFVGAGGGGGGGGADAGTGGNGGGAIALCGAEVIVAGLIDVSGTSPSAPPSTGMFGGGGGGSGGSVMVSGDQVTFANTAKLRALGGGGGPGAGGGTNGGNGGDGRVWIAAPSGHFTVQGNLDSQPQQTLSNAPLIHFPRLMN